MKKLMIAASAAAALVLASVAPAAAHVTVNPSEAPKGGYTKLTFRVPNESDTAGTTSVQIVFPEDHTFNARVKPVPGWTADVERTDAGVTSITWSGGPIIPGEFQEFDISGGPLPEDVDTLEFRAVQTYDDGEVVRWIDPVVPGEEEPEHPAPTLTLIEGDAHGGGTDEEAADEESAASAEDDSDDDGALPTVLSVIALVLGVAAIGIALTSRRRT